MRRFMSLVILTVLFAVIVVGFKPVRAEVIQNDRVPCTETFFNDCTGEDVLLAGETHTVVIRKEKDDGTIEIKTKINIHATGLGDLSGAEYVLNETAHESITDPPGIAFRFTSDVHTRLIGKGATPNERIIMSFVFEIDESGFVTLVDVEQIICQAD